MSVGTEIYATGKYIVYEICSELLFPGTFHCICQAGLLQGLMKGPLTFPKTNSFATFLLKSY